MKNESIDRDIASFVSEHLRNNRRLRKWEEHHARIERALTTRAHGVFRWVDCQFKALASCPQSEDLLEQLLDSLPQTLDETYERMLGNIPLTSKDYAQRMFNPKRKLKDIDAYQQVCPGFTELDIDPGTSALPRQDEFELAEYAARYWPAHFEDCNHDPLANNQVLRLFKSKQGFFENWVTIWNVDDKAQNREIPAPLYYASFLGLHSTVSGLLDDANRSAISSSGENRITAHLMQEKNADVNAQGGMYGNALQAASALGHEHIVKLLLQKGANINAIAAEVGPYRTALQAASAEGHETIVDLLLREGANVNAKAGSPGNALWTASYRGHERIIKLLLENGADVNAQSEEYGNPLQAASIGGHNKIIELLLEKGADIHAQGGVHGNALQAATYRRHDKTVELLLEKGADVKGENNPWVTDSISLSLSLAVMKGMEGVIRAFIDTSGMEIDSRDENGESPLSLAAKAGHKGVVKMFLGTGKVHVDSRDMNGRTPLSLAAEFGHMAVVTIFLNTGKVDVDAECACGLTVLQFANFNGNSDIEELLIARGALIPLDFYGLKGLFSE
ncbi:hypothetical protein FSARC_12149 [Fusarium sarcochroum]|uniref:Ankyrin repeat protein n=1 Tax=Fusarium sarcochroum TaxID=1208366 RepID=A0A8H4TAF1_9HYPO|nr:hypothetical protein FSARC_12149 [Fusarium sarcochroum]